MPDDGRHSSADSIVNLNSCAISQKNNRLGYKTVDNED
jgi:hypothetical protein